MDFEKICSIFSMQEPYYGILLSAMDRYPTKEVPTIGVRRSGNVFRLGYNPDFLADKDLNTILVLLKHETLHVALNHFTIWDDQNPSKEEHQLRNFACDLEANCYVDFSNTKGLNPVIPELFGWDRYLGSKEYRRKLLELNDQMQQQAQAKTPQKPCNGGQGGNGQPQPSNGGQNNPQNGQSNGQDSSGQNQQNRQNQQGGGNGQNSTSNGQSGQQNGSSNQGGNGQGNGGGNQTTNINPELEKMCQGFDDHSNWPDDMTEDEAESLKQAIDDLCDFAAEEVEKGRGTIPKEMEGRIKLIRDKKKPKPIADWKKFFRRYIGNEFSDQIKKSRKRESLRFPDAAGNRHRRKSHILVAIDTSGSVSMPEYREFFGQIRTMKDVTFHVVECDARIQFEYDFNGKIRETLHGGGGTDFQPVIDMYNENRRKYEGLICFTDGYCDIPRDTPKETLWVISSDGDKTRKKYQVNGASVVFIPKKQ
jgi:predicted metal-dependent peptidase